MKFLSAKMSLWGHILLLTALLAQAPAGQCAFLNATGMVSSLSFNLLAGTHTLGYKFHFNTYDPLVTYSRSQFYYSQEVIGSSGNFVTDFDIYDLNFGPYQGYSPVGYGTLSFPIPATDSDSDGLPDFLDRSKPFQSTVNVTVTQNLPSSGTRTHAATCYFNRGAGTEMGTYKFTVNGSELSGFFSLKYGKTQVKYEPETKTIIFSGDGFGYGNEFYSSDNGTGTTTYEILSPDSIKVNAFTFSTPSESFHVNTMTFTRSGNRFTVTGSMQDGLPYTPWADYHNFVFSITDTNDADTDGIPDLADDLIFLGPTIITEPLPAVISQGAAVDFTVAASSPYSLTYQWFHNGNILEGKTSGTLSLSDVQLAQAGNYKVVVTSNGKSKTSQTVTLTVQIPPTITSDPVGTTIVAGRTLTLTAGASGTPTPAYEWYRNNSLIDGQSGATLTINNITLAQGGDYQAKAINAAGNATTAIAKITVTTSVFSKPQNIDAANIQSSGFPLDLQLENGKTYRLEYSTDLITWHTLTTFTSTGTTKQHLDAAAASNPQRFYRLVKP